ncbi:MAG: 2-oxo-4-hydroxy-4-carboxy-5-ureidoimidazoline decarboxylase [Haloechinothrix sp.]
MSGTHPLSAVAEYRVAAFNKLPREEVEELLHACCDVPAWVNAVLCGRPYLSRRQVLDLADELARRFTDIDVDRALAAHPRIGERADGPDRESAWSRGEQSVVERDHATLGRLAAGNEAYERRFGRVFLICATGLSATEILAALQARLRHDDATERRVVADELRKIAVLRLGKVLDS